MRCIAILLFLICLAFLIFSCQCKKDDSAEYGDEEVLEMEAETAAPEDMDNEEHLQQPDASKGKSKEESEPVIKDGGGSYSMDEKGKADTGSGQP